jgi:myo-inositol-1(or 4)-monophosphatase
LASQETIRSLLLSRFPDHGFVGEEITAGGSSAADRGGHSEYTWIVDPLDGTTNYVHGLDNYSVSVALRRGHEIVLGTVFDPVRDECYSAIRGEGAFLNGQRLASSGVRELENALVAASLPARVIRDSVEVKRLLEVLYRCQALRRLGSAALNMCYIAAGRLDGYWATSVKAWDIAAGMLLIREAGGVATALDGGPLDLERPTLVAAGNTILHAELVAALAEAADSC